jgi:hypothetical protein
LAIHLFQLFFSCPPPYQLGWLASHSTCNGLWLQSQIALFLKRTTFLLPIKLHATKNWLLRLLLVRKRPMSTHMHIHM